MKSISMFISTLLLALNVMASSEVTKCGEYYIDRAGREVYTIGATGSKRSLGIFARDPRVQSVEVYPGYLEESILLTSGLSFSIRTSQGRSSAVMSDSMQSFDVGTCYTASAAILNPNTIGQE